RSNRVRGNRVVVDRTGDVLAARHISTLGHGEELPVQLRGPDRLTLVQLPTQAGVVVRPQIGPDEREGGRQANDPPQPEGWDRPDDDAAAARRPDLGGLVRQLGVDVSRRRNGAHAHRWSHLLSRWGRSRGSRGRTPSRRETPSLRLVEAWTRPRGDRSEGRS